MSQTLLLGKPVPVRSLCFRNEMGEWHRYRVCSIWDYSAVKFTHTPAQANLVKDENSKIGVKITGRHGGFVKVGAKKGIFDSLFAPFNALRGNARERQILAIGSLFFEVLRLKKFHIGVKSRNIAFPKNFSPKKYLF